MSYNPEGSPDMHEEALSTLPYSSANERSWPPGLRCNTSAENNTSFKMNGSFTAPLDQFIDAQTSSAQERTSPVSQRETASLSHQQDRKRSLNQQSSDLRHFDPEPEPLDRTTSSSGSHLEHSSGQRRLRTLHQHLESRDRQHGNLILARWQPDNEVDICPVCETRFSWLFRRHHCRKCGRVVCASCSQHRVTIPRKYVVQPPEQIMTEPSGFSDPSMPDAGSTEVVRVCNPCVPDPNFNPPSRVPIAEAAWRSYKRTLSQVCISDTSHSLRPEQQNENQYLHFLRTESQQSRTHSTHSASHQHRRSLQAAPARSSLPSLPANLQEPRQYGVRRSTLSGSSVIPPYRPFSDSVPARFHGRPDSGGLVTQINQPRMFRPGPNLPEEDECPVCGCELPPRDASDDDAARARHVVDCINSTGTLSSRTSRGLSIASWTQRGSVAAATEHPDLNDPGTSSAHATPPLARLAISQPTYPIPEVPHLTYPRDIIHNSNRHPRMLEYKGTEKDCLDERGEHQECIICFEEFQVADDMVRLECLCKFHERCIVDWWHAKHVTANSGIDVGCPTHVLHRYRDDFG